MKTQQPKEILRDFLKESNHRITSERFEVLEAAMTFNEHFSADELFIAMKRKKSSVSRATVYNTIDLLVKCNLISERNFGENIKRYESTYKKQSHDHLICNDCGRIIEFSSEKINEVRAETCEKLGFEAASHSFYIYGKCINRVNCPYFHEK
jgi:Fur family ferric uptake transcriptional regulator